ILPVIAFAAATAITATVLGGAAAFVGRMPEGSGIGMSAEESLMPFLVTCAFTASVLLIPSAVGLGGSAARLSLARREKDLATTRLIGGTSAQVGAVAVLDVAAQALVGALIGVGLHLAVTPALTHLDFGITPFTVADLLMPVWAYPLVALGRVLLAAGSAGVSLTGVVLSPLGVARDSRLVGTAVVRVGLRVARAADVRGAGGAVGAAHPRLLRVHADRRDAARPVRRRDGPPRGDGRVRRPHRRRHERGGTVHRLDRRPRPGEERSAALGD